LCFCSFILLFVVRGSCWGRENNNATQVKCSLNIDNNLLWVGWYNIYWIVMLTSPPRDGRVDSTALHADIETIVDFLDSNEQCIAAVAANAEDLARTLSIQMGGRSEHCCGAQSLSASSSLYALFWKLRQSILCAATCQEGLSYFQSASQRPGSTTENFKNMEKSSFRIVAVWFALASIDSHAYNQVVIQKVILMLFNIWGQPRYAMSKRFPVYNLRHHNTGFTSVVLRNSGEVHKLHDH
jgi:hypothetical protein